MARVTVTSSVRADPEAVFAYFSDPRAYAEAHRSHCRSLSITPETDRTAVSQEAWEFGGREIRVRHRIRVEPPRRIELLMLDGIGAGTRESVTLAACPEGSRLRYQVDFEVPGPLGPLLESLVAGRIRAAVRELAAEDREAVEGRGLVVTAEEGPSPVPAAAAEERLGARWPPSSRGRENGSRSSKRPVRPRPAGTGRARSRSTSG